MTLSNVRVVLCVCLLALIGHAPPSAALDRAGSVGVTFLAPLQVGPEVDDGDRVYGLDFGYFLDERWAAVLSWDVGLDGAKAIGLAAGPKFFFLPDGTVNPYWTTKFIYEVSPRNDLGWRINGGMEWNLRPLSGIENLALYGEAGVSQMFRADGPNLLNLELIRIGLNWSF